MEEDIKTIFIPAQAIEYNTKPSDILIDKLKVCARCHISHGSFTGDISDGTPNILVTQYHFNPEKMGYDVNYKLWHNK